MVKLRSCWAPLFHFQLQQVSKILPGFSNYQILDTHSKETVMAWDYQSSQPEALRGEEVSKTSVWQTEHSVLFTASNTSPWLPKFLYQSLFVSKSCPLLISLFLPKPNLSKAGDFILTRQEIFDIEPIMCVLWVDAQHVCNCMGIVFSQQSSRKVPTGVSSRKTIIRPWNLLTGHYFRVSWAGWEMERLNEGGKVRGAALQPGAQTSTLLQSQHGRMYLAEGSEY